MSRIDLQIVATGNFKSVQSQLAALQAQIASINSMGLVGATPAATASVASYASQLGHAVTSSGMYRTQMVNLTSETEKFGRALEKGNLRLRNYSRALTTQRQMVRNLAREQVRMASSQAFGLGNGRAMVVTPTGIDEAINKQKILNEQHRIFRQVVAGGSTQLINWGKNTQWAGRQMMVGLTMPLMIFGALAGKVFLDVDKELTRMAKVYGDTTKGMVSQNELDDIRQKTSALAQELANTMGVAATETAGIAADIAATGREGNDLLQATRESMRLSVLGEVDRQEAMRATLAIQTVFKKDTDELSDSINFLNSVENQTSTTLNDLVTGIVKAGPVVRGLGGDIEELSLMMVAMREGGVPASEAANAIKSSLASLINPTKQTTEMLGGFGINLKEIVDNNAGDLIGTLTTLQGALDNLDPLSRQRSIEQIFGKFQFARINALLSNLGKAGSQTEQVFKIAEMSATQLAEAAENELGLKVESASGRFQRAIEGIKASLIPVGQQFLEFGTKVLSFFQMIIEGFNSLPSGLKTILKYVGLFAGLVGPIIMLTGVLGNFFGYLVKGVAALMGLRRGLSGVYEYYTPESVAAKNITDLVSKSMYSQKTATEVLSAAIKDLNVALAGMASNMARVGSASSTAAAGATTLANAASQAAAKSLVSTMGLGSRGTLSGVERSHLFEGMKKSAPHLYGMQTTATILPPHSAAGVFQQKGFRPIDFYGSGAYANMSREQILRSQPAYQTAPGKAAFDVIKNDPSQQRMLLPTRAEYNKSAGTYIATLKQLASLPSQELTRLTAEMRSLIGAGRPEEARALLVNAVNANSAQFRAMVNEQVSSVGSITGKYTEVITRTAAVEAEALAKLQSAGMSRHVTGRGMDKFIYAAMGGGHGVMPGDGLRAAPAGPQAAQRLMGSYTPNERILGIQAQIDKVEQERLQAKRKDLLQQYRINEKETQREAILQKIAALESEKAGITGKSKTARNKIAAIDQQIASLAAQEVALRRSVAGHKGQATQATSAQLAAVEQRRALEAQREVAIRKSLVGQIMQANNIERSARGAVALTLAQEKSSLLKRIANIEATTIAGKKYFTLLNKHGDTLALLDPVTKKLIQGKEVAALKYQALSNAVRDELSSTTMSSFTRKKLNLWMESMSADVREQAVSHELVRQANGRYVLALKNAEGAIVAQSQQFRQGAFGGKMGGAAMGAGMAAGMGMMFLPQDGGAGSKIGGGALMGASMGAMMGSMVAPGIGSLVGLGVGAAAGAALPALLEFKKQQDEVNRSLMRYSEALNGSSLVLNKFAEETGALQPSEKLAAAIGKIESPEKVFEEGKAILETSAGQSLLENAKLLGGDQLIKSLTDQLKQLTLLEIFTPEQAKLVAQTLAIELGRPDIIQPLITGISTLLDSEGNLIKDNISELFMDTIPELTLPEFGDSQIASYEAVKSTSDELREIWTALSSEVMNFDITNILMPLKTFLPVLNEIGENIFNLFGIDFTTSTEEAEALDKFARNNIPGIVSGLDKLREAQALVVSEFMSGKMTYQEYVKNMEDIRKKNQQAAESLFGLKEQGVNVTEMIKDIARAGGLEDEFVAAENVAKEIMGILSLGEERNSRFYTQVQIAASYGDITEGDLRGLLTLIQDPSAKETIDLIFDVQGAEDNALEIIDLINSGMSADLLYNITVNAEEIGKPLTEVYAAMVALSQLPTNIQKRIHTSLEQGGLSLEDFIADYEYAMSLPDDDKELRAEVFGDDELKFFQDNWKILVDMDPVTRKLAIFEYRVSGSYTFPEAPPLPTPNQPGELPGVDSDALVTAAQGGGGGGGGGSADTSGIEKKYDKLIKAQDKIIEKIREEREERQKLLDLEKKAMDFALQKQDLENQILIAKSEGRLADAALLQAQLDARQDEYDASEEERIRQEREDKRIEAAEKRKRQLEKQKKKELDAAQGSGGGGGGGGGGGMSPEAAERLKKEIDWLSSILNQKLMTSYSEIVGNIVLEGASGFWDSEPVREFIKAATEAGVPLEAINAQLETTFDALVNQSAGDYPLFKQIATGLEEINITGAQAEQIIPNIFAILNDPELTDTDAIDQIAQQMEDAGASAQQARRLARQFFNQLPRSAQRAREAQQLFNKHWSKIEDSFDEDHAEIISRNFISGIKNGLTSDQILSSIGDQIYKSTYDDGVAAGLDPLAAEKKAESMSKSVKNKVKQEMKGFKVDVKHKATYDNSDLPPWLKGLDTSEIDPSDRGRMMRGWEIGHKHTITGDVGTTIKGVSNYGDALKVYQVNRNADGYNPGQTREGGDREEASGGYISGPGGPTSDIIPAWLSNGEFVIRAAAVSKFGIPFFESLNKGMLPEFARGGYSKYPSMIGKMARGGMVKFNNELIQPSQNIEYNINVKVADTNASPQSIAQEVMRAIDRKERMVKSVNRI